MQSWSATEPYVVNSNPRVLLLWLLYMGFLAVMGCPDVKFLRVWAVDVLGWYMKLGTHALPIGPSGIGPLTAEDQARSHWWKQACKSNKICCKQSLEIDIAIFSDQFISRFNAQINIFIYIFFFPFLIWIKTIQRVGDNIKIILFYNLS